MTVTDYAEAEGLHRRAMAMANEGFSLRFFGRADEAREVFRRAYALEMQAAAGAVGLDPSHAILMRSAAGCALHGELLCEAEDAARKALALPSAPGEKHRAGLILARAAVPRWVRSIPVACGSTLEMPASYAATALRVATECVVEVYGELLSCPVVAGYASAPAPTNGEDRSP